MRCFDMNILLLLWISSFSCGWYNFVKFLWPFPSGDKLNVSCFFLLQQFTCSLWLPHCLDHDVCYSNTIARVWFSWVAYIISLVFLITMAACSFRRDCIGSEGHVWEIWQWFSCSFFIKKLPKCSLPSGFGWAVLSEIAGILRFIWHAELNFSNGWR